MIRTVHLVSPSEARTDYKPEQHARWLPVAEAAAFLGNSNESLRLRTSRQTIGTSVDDNGCTLISIRQSLDGPVSGHRQAGVGK